MTAERRTMLDVRGLGVRVPAHDGEREVLQDVSLALRAGELHALVGASGAGKSMLVHAVTGMLPPGALVRGGATLCDEPTVPDLLAATFTQQRRLVRGRLVGVVPQSASSAFTPTRTVRSQLLEALRAVRGRRAVRGGLLPGHPHRPARSLTEHVVEVALGAGLDPSLLDRYPHELSGGQLTRAAVAAGMLAHPPVVLADEPTTGLDAASGDTVAAMLRTYARAGHAVLMITHDLDVAVRFADVVSVLHDGRVVEQGASGSVLTHPVHPQTRALVAGRTRSRTSPPASSGSGALAVRAGRPGRSLAAVGVEAVVGRRVLFSGLDLDVAAGEIIGLTGDSGVGKSTLAALVTLGRVPAAGAVHVDGTAVEGAGLRLPPDLRRTVGWISQHPHLAVDDRLTLARIVGLPARLAGIPVDVEALARRVRLPVDLLGRRPHEVSGGELQRACVARALALRPRYLVCDEMTSMLDAATVTELLAVVADEARTRGTGILLVSHDVPMLHAWADRSYRMAPGPQGARLVPLVEEPVEVLVE